MTVDEAREVIRRACAGYPGKVIEMLPKRKMPDVIHDRRGMIIRDDGVTGVARFRVRQYVMRETREETETALIELARLLVIRL